MMERRWTLRGNHKKEDFQVQLQNVHSTVQCTQMTMYGILYHLIVKLPEKYRDINCLSYILQYKEFI
jgi:hypothetical protein